MGDYWGITLQNKDRSSESEMLGYDYEMEETEVSTPQWSSVRQRKGGGSQPFEMEDEAFGRISCHPHTGILRN